MDKVFYNSYLHLLIPTALLPADHVSMTKTHRNVVAPISPSRSDGLSWSRRPLRNQWTVCFSDVSDKEFPVSALRPRPPYWVPFISRPLLISRSKNDSYSRGLHLSLAFINLYFFFSFEKVSALFYSLGEDWA